MAPIDESEREEILTFLRRGDWFAGLPAALQEQILRRSVPRSYPKGTLIHSQGFVPAGLSALLEGRIEMVRHLDDEEVLVHMGEPGFWFGELGILGGRAAAVSILAETDVRTLLLRRRDFEEIVDEEPRFYRAMAGLAFDRYDVVLGFLAQAGGLSAEARLRHRLAGLVALRRSEGAVGKHVVLDLSQSTLARSLGVTRQTLNALLGRLEAEGLIKVGFRRIRVLDEARVYPGASLPLVETEK